MALSNSIDFTLTRDDAIEEALSQLGMLGEGESPTAAQLAADGRTLNLMLKAWQNKEVSQSLIRRFYLWMEPDKREYVLSTTAASSAHSAYDFYTDTTAAAYVDGALALTVSAGTGAADSDTLLLQDDDGSLLSGTISSGGGTTSLVIPDLNGDAASGNTYYAYTSKVTRPVDILYAERHLRPTSAGEHNVAQSVSHPVKVGVRRDWQELSAKHTEGATTMVWYNEAGVSQDWEDAVLHVWPEPTGYSEYLELWGQFTIDDMDSAADNFALPSKWYLAVAFNLALWLTPKYGVSDKTFGRITSLAAIALEDAEAGESESYIQFVPDNRWRR